MKCEKCGKENINGECNCTKKKSNKKISLRFVIIMGTFVLVSLSAIRQVNLYLMLKNYHDSNSENDNISDTKLDPDEQEIIDDTLKETLKDKLTTLIGYRGLGKEKNAILVNMYDPFFDNIFTNSLTNEEKLNIILTSYSKKYNEEESNSCFKKYAEKYGFFDSGCMGEMTEEELQKQANNLFGSSLYIYQEVTGKCPWYVYLESEKKYIQLGGCGGTGPFENVEFYINRYTKKDNKAYIYVNVAEDGVENVKSDKDARAYYILKDYLIDIDSNIKDFDSIKEESIYKKTSFNNYNDFRSSNTYNFPIINASNYKEFQEYVFVFNLDENNNYYFSKVIKK